MLRKVYRPYLFAFAIALGFVACSTDDRLSGDVTEAGTVAGKVLDTLGHPQAGVVVQIVSAKFNPFLDEIPKTLTDTTTTDGKYSITVAKNSDDIASFGSYTVMASQDSKGFKARSSELTLDTTAHTSLDPLTLKYATSLTVNLSEYIQVGSYIHLPGTPFGEQVSQTDVNHGYVKFDSIPQGLYAPAKLATNNTLDLGVYITDTIPLASSKPVTVETKLQGLPGFQNKVEISYNLSSIYVPKVPLGHFPLYITLDQNQIDFSLLSPNADDIRISNSKGKLLPHEIENFDPIQKTISLWTSVDSIPLGSREITIYLSYGKPNAPSVTNPTAIFDPSHGHLATWHMSHPLDDIDSTILSSTPGFPAGIQLGSMNANQLLDGKLGKAVYFDGSDDGFDLGLFQYFKNPIRELTLSAWVYPYFDTTTETHHMILEFADAANNNSIVFFYHHLLHDWRFRVVIGDSTYTSDTQNRSISWGSKAWHNVVGVFEKDSLYIYWDGELSFKHVVTTPLPAGNYYLTLGNSTMPNYAFWGKLDEVRICKVARSKEYIRLQYLTQNNLPNVRPIDP